MIQQLEIWGTSDPNISAQLALAIKMGFFHQEAGFDVSYRLLESGTMMPSEILKADRKPFAFTQTPITAILLRDKGFKVKVIAPLSDIAGTQQMIIHPDSGIVHPKDLEGKRVGMAQDAAIYMAVRNMSKDYGINLSKVKFVNLLPKDQLAAFAAGRLDAIACWEPWTTKARNMDGRMYFSGARSEIPGMEGDVNWLVDQGCLIVPEERLAKYPQEVLALLNIFRNTTMLLNEHRQDVARQLAAFFGMSHRDLIIEMRKNLYSMKFDNLFRIGLLGFRDFLYKEGQVSTFFSEQELYDTSWLQQIDPTLISIEETATSQTVPIVERANVYYRKDVTIVSEYLDIRFLVADDSKVVRNALSQTIEILGGTMVAEAATGQEAIEQFTLLHPNFVTMDLSMPGISGVDAIKHILKIAPDTNIIVISATDLKELREEVFDLGVKIFIVKPFDPLLVAEIIGLLLL